MTLTETKIRQIIKEELIGFLNEIADAPEKSEVAKVTKNQLAKFISTDNIREALKSGKYNPKVEDALVGRLEKLRERVKTFFFQFTLKDRNKIYESDKNNISQAPSSGYFLNLVDPFAEGYKSFPIGRSKVEMDAFFSIVGK